MLFHKFLLPARVLQILLACIALGVLAYASHDWAWYWSPSEINFLIFVSIWTLLAVAYLAITPGRFPVAAHKYGILAAEAITLIFWLAGFIALAVFLHHAQCSSGRGARFWGPCRAAIAGDVFAAFETLLFAATTAMSALDGCKSGGGNGVMHNQAAGV